VRPAHALLAVRILQLAIFVLGGLCYKAADDGAWFFAGLWLLIAWFCYLALTTEIQIEQEEE